jgi:hypothetical protein
VGNERERARLSEEGVGGAHVEEVEEGGSDVSRAAPRRSWPAAHPGRCPPPGRHVTHLSGCGHDPCVAAVACGTRGWARRENDAGLRERDARRRRSKDSVGESETLNVNQRWKER